MGAAAPRVPGPPARHRHHITEAAQAVSGSQDVPGGEGHGHPGEVQDHLHTQRVGRQGNICCHQIHEYQVNLQTNRIMFCHRIQSFAVAILACLSLRGSPIKSSLLLRHVALDRNKFCAYVLLPTS